MWRARANLLDALRDARDYRGVKKCGKMHRANESARNALRETSSRGIIHCRGLSGFVSRAIH